MAILESLFTGAAGSLLGGVFGAAGQNSTNKNQSEKLLMPLTRQISNYKTLKISGIWNNGNVKTIIPLPKVKEKGWKLLDTIHILHRVKLHKEMLLLRKLVLLHTLQLLLPNINPL